MSDFKNIEYKNIVLPEGIRGGDVVQIKFDNEGVVYDLFDKDGEHIESYGYDFYHEIKNIEKDLDNWKIVRILQITKRKSSF